MLKIFDILECKISKIKGHRPSVTQRLKCVTNFSPLFCFRVTVWPKTENIYITEPGKQMITEHKQRHIPNYWASL